MTLISYAQNYEDVMLWRALKDVVGGCYIDVGANDPLVFSVTKTFYDQGWRGINIEPMQQYYQRLCEQRTEDVNLSVGAGEKNGFMTYYEIPDTGLSTLDETIAEQHKKDGWKVLIRSIALMSLSTVCEHYVKGPIHFLKVDVEGAEKLVLLGMDFTHYRPWIVIVESTVPMSQQENSEAWEYILLDNNYKCVYFDGLNRYYISHEKVADLESAFSVPPNVFDSFQPYSEYNLTQEKKSLQEALQVKEAQCQKLEETLQEKEDQRQQLKQALQNKEDQRQQIEQLFNIIEKSRSWRFTMPIRLVANILRKIKAKLRGKNSSGRSLRGLIKAVLIHAVQFIQIRPRLKAFLKPVISSFPGLKARLKRMKTGKFVARKTIHRIDNAHNLSPRAAQIHIDLMQALAQKPDMSQRKD
jgi:FkbM family methyltransferase